MTDIALGAFESCTTSSYTQQSSLVTLITLIEKIHQSSLVFDLID